MFSEVLAALPQGTSVRAAGGRASNSGSIANRKSIYTNNICRALKAENKENQYEMFSFVELWKLNIQEKSNYKIMFVELMVIPVGGS